MLSKKFGVIVILLLSMTFVGYQCSSTELTSAKLYIQQKNYPKAIESLNKEVSKNAKSDEGFYLLGVVYAEQQNYDKMVENFDKSLSISNKFAKQINDYRTSLYVQNYNKGAEFIKRSVNQTDKDSIAANLGRAGSAFEAAVAMQPDSISAVKNLAYVYQTSGKEQELEKVAKRLSDKGIPEGYVILGDMKLTKGRALKNSYVRTKNVQDSVEAYKIFNEVVDLLAQGRAKNNTNPEIMATLSNAYIEAGRANEAMGIFEEGVKQQPENKSYRYNYGVLLLNNNNFEAALTQFNKAVEIDPKFVNAIYNLGATYFAWGRFLEKQAEEKNQLGNKEYQEKYNAAVPYFEQAVKLNEKDNFLWEALAKVYLKVGKVKEAEDIYSRIK